MDKVGIITIIDYNNYGNRLQNYAVQEIIKSLEFDPITIINEPISSNRNLKERLKDKTLKDVFKYGFYKTKKIITPKKYTHIHNARVNSFKKWSEKYIIESDFTICTDKCTFETDNFKYFVAGSDQIWNPNFRSGFSADFLSFAPVDKRIAFAPSFGIEKIPDRYEPLYKKYLSEFKALSVREKSGAKIIHDLTGREAEVLLDPTLTLEKEKWVELVKENDKITDDNYIMTYFLGNITENTKKYIEKIAKDTNFKIINFGDIKNEETYVLDPSSFIAHIYNAKAIFTDSFHGVAFSIIFNKPFLVFRRLGAGPSMYTRIENILEIFNLHSREFNINYDIDNIMNIDYTEANEILEIERRKAFNYLMNSFDLNEQD